MISTPHRKNAYKTIYISDLICFLLFPTDYKDSGRESETVLAVALEVTETGVVVVGLHGAYPDMFGYSQVQTAADGHGKRCVVAGRELADRRGEIAIESMRTAEESLPEGLRQAVRRNAQTDASHAADNAE
jgi:hypothetical protein